MIAAYRQAGLPPAAVVTGKVPEDRRVLAWWHEDGLHSWWEYRAQIRKRTRQTLWLWPTWVTVGTRREPDTAWEIALHHNRPHDGLEPADD